MTKAVLKTKLKKAIDQVDDEKVLEAFYAFLNSHIYAEDVELSDEVKADLDARLARDKAGLEKGASWSTVRARIKKKKA